MLLFAAASACILLLTSCRKEEYNDVSPESPHNEQMRIRSDETISEDYIVVLKEDAFPQMSEIFNYDQRSEKARTLMNQLLIKNNLPEVVPERVYHSALKGFSCRLNSVQFNKLKADPVIDFIEADKIINVGPHEGFSTLQTEQSVPYGISRVGWTSAADGTGKVAWIIDTGIDVTHPDLNVDVARSKSFLLSGKNAKSPNDENGHGTHVAGTIGARNNSFGVVGVAPNATLISVRVLNQKGSGTVSGVINGVDFVAANGEPGDVANMSLGGGASLALDKAVLDASKKGIYFAVSAGNSSANAGSYSPARVNGSNVFTVSAMDSSDNWAYFSNYGNPPVDYCAPGVMVMSTWKGGGYRTISGTSMAAPHVAGVLLMKNGSPASDGTVYNDPDGNADAIVHL